MDPKFAWFSHDLSEGRAEKEDIDERRFAQSKVETRKQNLAYIHYLAESQNRVLPYESQ